jgi:hypothetical protein
MSRESVPGQIYRFIINNISTYWWWGGLEGESCWVGCGWVSWVGRGGEERASGHVQQGRFSLDDTRFQTETFFYVIYYILNSGGFTESSFRSSWKVSSTSTSWEDMCTVQVSTTRWPLPHTEDSEGTGTPQELVVFGYIEVSCEHYTPNMYRCIPT